MIELNQLEQLIYIAENKTISKAAKELLLSQSSPFTLYAKIRK